MTGTKDIYLLGVGHNTPVFIDLARACGYHVCGLYHYTAGRTGDTDHGIEIVGTHADLLNSDMRGRQFLLTMGDNYIRARLMEQLSERGSTFPTLVHPKAIVSGFACVNSCGVCIGPFTEVKADSHIESGSIILSSVIISHTSSVGRYCLISNGAIVGAYTALEEYVLMGQGAMTVPEKCRRIGRGAIIGAGAVVTRDVEAGITVAGNPARPLARRVIDAE